MEGQAGELVGVEEEDGEAAERRSVGGINILRGGETGISRGVVRCAGEMW